MKKKKKKKRKTDERNNPGTRETKERKSGVHAGEKPRRVGEEDIQPRVGGFNKNMTKD